MEEMQKTEAALVVRSVNSLQWLYTIVLSLAITEAIKAVICISSNPDMVSIQESFLPTFLTLIITLIPFHQGMNTYLDATYIHQKTRLYAFAGLVDFIFFFSEAVIFYVMALLIKQPKSFYTWLLILLTVDVLWIAFVYFANKTGFKAVWWWGLINGLTVLVLFIILKTPLLNDDMSKWVVLASVALIRTVADYAKAWPFYWPYNNKASEDGTT